MRIVEVATACDRCGKRLAAGRPVGEWQYRIGLDKRPQVTADICPDCRKSLEDILLPIMEAAQQPKRKAAGNLSPSGIPRVPCEVCGKPVAPGVGASMHRLRMHEGSP